MSLNFNQIVYNLARERLWSKVGSDYQLPILAEVLSGPNGFTGGFTYMTRYIPLPDTTNTYHVFVVGRYNPELMNAPLTTSLWNSFLDTINNNNIYASGYTDIGIEYPRKDLFYSFGKTKNLFIALKWNPYTGINYKNIEDIAFRFYSSVYLDKNPDLKYSCLSLDIKSNTDIANTTSFINQYSTEPNNVSIYVNGQYSSIDKIILNTTVDVIYDPCVKNVLTLNVDTLPVFNSELDSERKYLFHVDDSNDTLDFLSDIDFYVLASNINNLSSYVGNYYHRNNIANVRNITFHDYSLLTRNVFNIIEYYQNNLSQYTFQVRAVIKHSGLNDNQLTSDHRLLEICQLNQDLQETAIVGINAINSTWSAIDLEKSKTMELVQSYLENLDQFDFISSIGYSGLSQVLCDPIKQIGSHNNPLILPLCYTTNSTILEYDYNGLLTSVNYNDSDMYSLKSNTTQLVEFMNGEPTSDYNDIYTIVNSTISLDQNIGFRVYGLSNNIWSDITSQYTNGNPASNTIYPDTSYETTLLKTNEYFLMVETAVYSNVYGCSIPLNDPYESFIPYGTYIVYLNGYRLVKDIDFGVINSIVHIYNHSLLSATQENIVIVMCKYFCTDLLQELNFRQVGIIENNDINVRSLMFNDQKPHMVVFNNRVYASSETFNNPYIYYSVEDIIPNMNYYLLQDSQNLKEAEYALDSQLRAMVLNINNNPPVVLSAIPNRKVLISVFLSTVLFNLINNEYATFIHGNYNLGDIDQLLNSLNYLLEIDPLTNPNISELYFDIVGFYTTQQVSLDPYQYKFYKQVLGKYNNGKLNYNATLSNISIYA